MKVIASDGLKTASQEFKINFYNDVPDIKTDVPSLEKQFESLKQDQKPQVGKDFRFELDSPFEDTDGDGLDMSAKMRLVGDSPGASSKNSTLRLLAAAACTSNVTVSKEWQEATWMKF